ncbi:MAG: hypothetical protein M3N08_08760, partial [Pseudomonadota bacterium]|nr:hypothetical protein [Pseudomonadota bacterium]
MNIADDNQNPRPGKKLGKSLDAIAALRVAMEQRLAQPQKDRPATAAAVAQALAPEASVLASEITIDTGQTPTARPLQTASTTRDSEAPGNATPASSPAENGASESEASRSESPAPNSAAPAGSIKEAQPRDAPANKFYDPAEWSRILYRIGDRSQRLIQSFVEQQRSQSPELPAFDPGHIFGALSQLMNRLVQDPERFTDSQIALWQGYAKIWQRAFARMTGQPAEPVVAPSPLDRRFQDKDWQNVWLFDFIKQSYLLTSQWAHSLVRKEAEQLEPKLAHKIDFYVDQMLDAMSPTNFWLTNPEVLRTTFETGGENLIKGLENLLQDLDRGHGKLLISMSDDKAFRVGENLATTKGQVIYRNDLMELIQYEPQTPSVHKTPLLIVPPWINKFYILDLREKNSFIRYLVTQGHTVFCISWVNPDGRFAATNFEDYLTEGALTAMQQVRLATQEDTINLVGYCIGGTLLASTLAWLKAATAPPPGLPEPLSATYLVTMVDFEEPG